MKKFIIVFLILICSNSVHAFEYGYTQYGYKYVKHQHSESSYQHAWCKKNCGIEEYKNDDFTRVDCLTKTHAVEFDFANKWAESVGQTEHYSLKTGKKGKVVVLNRRCSNFKTRNNKKFSRKKYK